MTKRVIRKINPVDGNQSVIKTEHSKDKIFNKSDVDKYTKYAEHSLKFISEIEEKFNQLISDIKRKYFSYRIRKDEYPDAICVPTDICIDGKRKLIIHTSYSEKENIIYDDGIDLVNLLNALKIFDCNFVKYIGQYYFDLIQIFNSLNIDYEYKYNKSEKRLEIIITTKEHDGVAKFKKIIKVVENDEYLDEFFTVDNKKSIYNLTRYLNYINAGRDFLKQIKSINIEKV